MKLDKLAEESFWKWQKKQMPPDWTSEMSIYIDGYKYGYRDSGRHFKKAIELLQGCYEETTNLLKEMMKFLSNETIWKD